MKKLNMIKLKNGEFLVFGNGFAVARVYRHMRRAVMLGDNPGRYLPWQHEVPNWETINPKIGLNRDGKPRNYAVWLRRPYAGEVIWDTTGEEDLEILDWIPEYIYEELLERELWE